MEITKIKAIELRNYILVMMSLANAVRASNIMNITIYDFQKARQDKEILKCKVIESKNYKTSLLYGTKVIACSEDLYRRMTLYIEHARPLMVDDKLFPPEQR